MDTIEADVIREVLKYSCCTDVINIVLRYIFDTHKHLGQISLNWDVNVLMKTDPTAIFHYESMFEMKHGTSMCWRSGMLDNVINYSHGKLDGTRIYWRGIGNRISSYNNYHRGEYHGKGVHWVNGKLTRFSNHKHGKLHGLQYNNYCKSHISFSTYVNGKLHGPYMLMDDGRITMYCTYVHRKLDGNYMKWSDGVLTNYSVYNMGKQVKVFVGNWDYMNVPIMPLILLMPSLY